MRHRTKQPQGLQKFRARAAVWSKLFYTAMKRIGPQVRIHHQQHHHHQCPPPTTIHRSHHKDQSFAACDARSDNIVWSTKQRARMLYMLACHNLSLRKAAHEPKSNCQDDAWHMPCHGAKATTDALKTGYMATQIACWVRPPVKRSTINASRK